MKATKRRILCAEDHPDTCALLETVLGLVGYEVVSAGTVAEALRQARSERFDLYVVDEVLPDGSGTEMIGLIRGFDPRTPIVVHSADAREATRLRALAAGAQAFVPKPSDLYELIGLIKRLIEPTGGGIRRGP